VRFIPCTAENTSDCASSEEIENFLASHSLIIAEPKKYVDMAKVKVNEDTIEESMHVIMNKRIKPASLQSYNLHMDEHRIELFDDRINLLGMSSPKKLSFVNISDKVT